MANLLAAATGNFATAATWGAIDATSELDSEAASTAVSTSNLDSSTFVLPATAVDGVALKIAGRAASPTGTFTVIMRNSTAGSDTKTVVVNVADIHVSGLGFVTFKFASSFTPNGTDAYLIRVVCSSTGSQVTLYRNGTSNNWSRKVRTTTTQAPASGNHLVVSNELTGAGTSNALTVTMDNTATTSFGPTVSGGPPQGIVVSGGGTLTCGTAASTDYYFKYKGVFLVCGGGTVNWGTSGTQIPSTSTLTVEMDSASNVDTGLWVGPGGTCNGWGPTKTICTLMTADAAAAATSLTVGSTTGWENGDNVIIAGTGQATNDNESRTINTVGSSTTCAITAGLTTARTNAAIYPPEIINLTSRFKIRGVSGALNGYIIVTGSGVLVLRYCEVYQLGSGTTNKMGIDLQQTGSADIQKCSSHDWNTSGVRYNITGASLGVNTTIKDCGAYDINGQGRFITIPANVATSITIDGNYVIKSNQEPIVLFRFDITAFKNNRIVNQTDNVSAGILFSFTNGTNYSLWGLAGADAWAGNVIHGVYRYGIRLTATNAFNFGADFPVVDGLYFKNWFFYLCSSGTGSGAIHFTNGMYLTVTLESVKFYGNDSAIEVANNGYTNISLLRLVSVETAGSVTRNTITSNYGLKLQGTFCRVYAENCSFGKTGTGLTTETNNILVSSIGTTQIITTNCLFGGTNPVVGMSTAADPCSYVRNNRYGQSSLDHRSFFKYGSIKSDSVIYNVAAPSERVAPLSASIKLESSPEASRVATGVSRTFTVKVRKSVLGDGVAYNGNQPRLMLRRNFEAGITADVVLATAAGAAGSFETLTGASASVSDYCVLEAFVDCDGTAGWINIDDWTKS